jgi:predicted transcriptional regulator
MAFVNPAVLVSVTVAEILDVPVVLIVAGLALTEAVNVSDEVTVIVPADEFQFQSCHVELNAPISTV